MRKSKLWKKLLHVEHVVLEGGDIEEAPDGSEIAVVRLRPDSGHRLRCPECGGKREVTVPRLRGGQAAVAGAGPGRAALLPGG